MPSRFAASITSVPAGVVTFPPLIVNVTCLCSVMRVLVCSGDHLGRFVCALPVKMILEFIAPLVDDADRGHGRGVAQRTERPPEHILRQFINQRNVLGAAAALVEAIEQLPQPGGAFAT